MLILNSLCGNTAIQPVIKIEENCKVAAIGSRAANRRTGAAWFRSVEWTLPPISIVRFLSVIIGNFGGKYLMPSWDLWQSHECGQAGGKTVHGRRMVNGFLSK
jgi:hypothetical protein